MFQVFITKVLIAQNSVQDYVNMNYNTCDEYLSLSQFLEIQYK